MLSGLHKVTCIVLFATVAAAAHAVPVQYRFTSGTVTSSGGVVQGLIGADETAFGTFTYEADSASIGTTPFALGDGDIYASIVDWEGFVGGRRLFDASAGTLVANDVATGGVDSFRLTGTEAGGAWTPFSLGGYDLVRAQIIIQEGLFDGIDFLTSNAQPAFIPEFLGILRLEFGGTSTSPAGFVQLIRVRVERVAVSEPTTLHLLPFGLAAIVGMAFGCRRRRIAKI